MMLQVMKVHIPPWSTVGYGEGVDPDTGAVVTFAGDHRPMRSLGEALGEGEPVYADVEPWQVLPVTADTPNTRRSVGALPRGGRRWERV